MKTKPRLVEKFRLRSLCGCCVNGRLTVCQSSSRHIFSLTFCCLFILFSDADLEPTVCNLGFGSRCLSGRTFALPAAANVAKPTIVILSCRIKSHSGEHRQ